jgi:hypothetical protein
MEDTIKPETEGFASALIFVLFTRLKPSISELLGVGRLCLRLIYGAKASGSQVRDLSEPEGFASENKQWKTIDFLLILNCLIY